MVRSRVLLSAVLAALAVTLAGCDETGVYPSVGYVASVLRRGVLRRALLWRRLLWRRRLRMAGTASVAESIGVPGYYHGGFGGYHGAGYRGGGYHGGGFHGGGFHGGGGGGFHGGGMPTALGRRDARKRNRAGLLRAIAC